MIAGCCCIVLISATGLTVQRYLQDYLREESVDKLVVSLDELLSRLEIASTTDKTLFNPISRLSESRFSQPYSGFYWQIQDEETILKRSRSLWDTELRFRHLARRLGLNDFIIKGPEGSRLLVVQQKVKLPESSDFYWVSIAQDMAPLQDTLAGVNRSLLFGLGLLTLAVILLITLQLTWGLRPLTTLRKELSLIESGEQDCFEHNYPEEINPLVQDINQLLAHHQQSLEQARTNAGNMAHALKTPLSIMQNELSLPTDVSKVTLQKQLEQMRSHIEYHLSTSQIAAKQLLGVKCSPYQQCCDAVGAFSRLYQDKLIAAEVQIDKQLMVAVDHRDFDEILGNLIENAFKWAESKIVISANVTGDFVEITLVDDGKGMTDAECQWAMHRGQRLDEQSVGHGLGLNIAVEMARLYQGELILSRADIGGLSACVRLPIRK